MALLDFLFGSKQGGGTQAPPPAPVQAPSSDGSSLVDLLSVKPASTTLMKSKPIAPAPILGLPPQKPLNPLIDSVIPSATDDYNKFAEQEAKANLAKQQAQKEKQQPSIMNTMIKPGAKLFGDAAVDLAKGAIADSNEIGGGILDFAKGLVAPVVQTTGAASLRMFQGADWLAAKAAGKEPTKLTPQQKQAVDTMTAQGIDSIPATILTLGTFGGAGAFSKLALPTAMMRGAISEMQGKGLKTSSADAVKMYIFSKLLSLPLGKAAMATLSGGMQVANEVSNGQNPLAMRSIGETAAATGLGFLGGRAREKGFPLGETPPAHETAIGGGEEPVGPAGLPIEGEPSPNAHREVIQDQLANMQHELQVRQELLAQSPDFAKYKGRKEGMFPEVTGEISNKKVPSYADEFKQRGDQIAQEHGFADPEELMSHQETVDSNKARVAELKTQIKNLQSIHDNLPTIEEPVLPKRGFLETVKNSEETTSPVQKRVQDLRPQTYEPVTNASAVKAADELVKSSPETAQEYLSQENPPSAEKGAIAIRLAKHYEEQGRAAGIAGDEKLMNQHFDRAVDVIDTYDKQLRESGRFVQAASLWSEMTPEGMLRKATREVEKANSEKGLFKKWFKKGDIELTPEDKRAILKEMGDAQSLPEGSPERQAKVNGVLQRIADKTPIGASEMFDAYRYQNMLSGPQTQERNIYSNLLQTFITRPADIAVGSGVDWIRSTLTGKPREMYISDVPDYYKGIWNSQIDAMHAAVEALKGLSGPAGKLDSTGDITTTIRSMRRPKTEAGRTVMKGLTVTTRMLEAADKYFSTLISSGERARLQDKGMTDMEINTKANELAEKTLFRGKLEADPDAPLLSRALTSLGQSMIELRKKPVIGKPASWFVPFVTTPVRVAKTAVESSPLGFIGGSYENTQVAKATIGSIITLGGAWMAMNNKTTWDAPTDKKAKDEFYAAGRKPYSVLIGNKWVPMWYFGPYAFAMAIPAVIKQKEFDSKTKLTDGQLAKVAGITADLAKFIGSQSPLQGMTGFLRMIQGDVDYSLPSNLGFTAGQVIPLEGLLRYVDKIVDPVYRKGTTFSGSMESGIPGLSQKLPAYKDSKGNPEKRDPMNLLLPYDLGNKNNTFDKAYQDLTKKAQKNAVKNKKQNIMGDKSLSSKERSAKLRALKNGGGIFDGVPILDSLFSGEGNDPQESNLPAFNPP